MDILTYTKRVNVDIYEIDCIRIYETTFFCTSYIGTHMKREGADMAYLSYMSFSYLS